MITLIATIVAIVGCMNWLLVGIFGFDFITWMFGTGFLSTASFIIVGLAGLWLIFYLVKTRLIDKQRENSLKMNRSGAQTR